ncbi:MAG TPA: hypothetical protein VF028_06690 [Actinomycetota bacterium]|nr:hypothetical protein [Actinomycetota bacterium]
MTGAGSANTGLEIITGINIAVSAAATVSLRAGASNGAIMAQQVFTAAGFWSPNIPSDGVLCPSSGTGTWFVENSAGNMTGGVFGRDTTG